MSEIFNTYAQIMLDQGLISEAEDQANPRYDSVTLSDIELLYGIKPNGDDDKILEKAHPEPVVIAPAYDRVNGLVENLQERHNIMCGIARKPNNALLTQHRYVEAHNELLNEVIKVGFLLDSQNDEALTILADSCAERITKVAALPPLVIAGIIAGVAALVGGERAVFSSNNPKSQGIKQDAQRTMIELDEAIDDYPQLKGPLGPVIDNVHKLSQLADNFIAYNDLIVASLLKVSSATTPEEKRNAIAKNAAELFKSGRDKEILRSFQSFKEVCDAIAASAPEAIRYLRGAKEKYEGADYQVWRSIKDFWNENVLSSDAEDAARMLAVLAKSASGISTAISEQTGKLSALREQVGQMPAGGSTESKPEKAEESKRPDAKSRSALPSWG